MLKKKDGQIVTIKEIEVQFENVQATFPAAISLRGNSYYVRLDPHFIRFYELQPGDQILVTVTKAKREIKRY